MDNYYTILCEQGKRIDVFDNVFPLRFREHALEFFRNSSFRIGWSDVLENHQKEYDEYFYSRYTEEDVNNLGIVEYLQQNENIVRLLDGLELKNSIVNSSLPSDVNYIHSHKESKVVLYYANTEWKQGSHGETIFYSEDTKEIQYTSPYTPGRIIIFDGSIPHTIRPQSIIGPKYRFTFAMVWDKVNV